MHATKMAVLAVLLAAATPVAEADAGRGTTRR